MPKKKINYSPFVGIGRLTMASKEYIELSSSSKVVYLQLKYHFNGHNNGKITVSLRTLAKETGLNLSTVKRAKDKLVEKGWIEITNFGGLYNNMDSYKLTGKYDNWIIDKTKEYEAREQGNTQFLQQKKTEELKKLIPQNTG